MVLPWSGEACRDVLPTAHLLSFASPKESKQRKGDPAVCVPGAPGAPGQPAVLAVAGVRANSPSARTRAALNPAPAALLGAARRGWGNTGHRCARPGQETTGCTSSWGRAQRWPVGLRRYAESSSAGWGGKRGARVRAEGEFARLPHHPSNAVSPKGRRIRLAFFCLLSLGEARESRAPAGARPGLQRQQKKQCKTAAHGDNSARKRHRNQQN